MRKTSIQLTDYSTKFGVVQWLNADGVVTKRAKIPAAEADALRDGLIERPLQCSPREWETGLVVSTTWAIGAGQAAQNADGTLVVNFGTGAGFGELADAPLMLLQPNEYMIQGGELWVEDYLCAQIDVTPIVRGG